MFWIGLLIGLLVGLLAWDWLGWLGVLIAVVALGALHLVTKGHGHGIHVSAGSLFWVLVFVVGALTGLYFGRQRGLRHLGEHEYRTRSGYIRNISSF
jgi:hypothetical protein